MTLQTRRFLLAGGAALFSGGFAGGAVARPRHKPAPSAAPEAPAATGGTVPETPATTPVGPVDTMARWACILDYGSGATVLEKNADERMPPSSLTKMMTAYVTFGMLRAGRLKLDQMLPVSERAWRMQGSKMFVPLGQSVAVQDLVQGMIIQSGNDACIVLSEGISGSQEQFVALMNDTAAKLGLTNSHFMNATGWPADNHYMSARDVAYLALRLIHDFPEYYHFFSEKEFIFNKIHQENRNSLVVKGLADGLKTGHTDAGGFGLCASSERDGRRVVMAINGLPSDGARGREGERLMGWAFANFETAQIINKGEIVEQAPVWMGASQTVPLVVAQEFRMLLPHGWKNSTHVAIDYDSPLIAPVSEGQVVGQLSVVLPGGRKASIPLVAGQAVPALGLLGRAARRLHL
ncbi:MULTISPECIES: D-alanyl-D-alanine carboxypeptidase family protein [Acetobacter]|uniref:serine-type D-Ala-D-Ala carboxypeptidase n=1 Tax=Acetobacter lovaniensis TaxID=104100 RepID=A0A841QAP4_9PROT|nr:D-alanyl-D-alanine carboxypeptidase family protein [Acetobacter lovaniensis]MBB6455591.1 D-alanyl-D-alanine carboxypeptidase (penicillin-binding protein 5/6) [Acetobacter lovaniensis]MCI1697475.1 D-alanyl-D-alanine carboxypeptidase [Acetobacter lovaniensis]MCI1796339.1 D-alanyl-D-alanine carboxypeptidase [Acetobacter lovaniensis]MCP1238573.1 D-alanyl-D-alanine carboxypeptidase [Acetobacter lovaniensis]NHN79991.1 D-alanyl-D-alanine carboxypeptidase [Acetobacter lovaniensis]